MVQRKFTCPICKQPKFKKELLTQTMSATITEDGIKVTHTYKRVTCTRCNKSLWVTKDGLVLIKGN